MAILKSTVNTSKFGDCILWTGKNKISVKTCFDHLQGPINEKRQDYFIDCYFRQSWVDNRLKFNSSGGVSELPMNWQFLNKIWKPDTFFLNGKKSKMHKITVRNIFVPDTFVYIFFQFPRFQIDF